MRHVSSNPGREQGFTLVELLVSMVVAMVLLAGLYGNFIMQSRVQNAQSEVVESAEDLRLAAQIMQGELRLAEATCWDAGNSALVYKTLGSPDLSVCNSAALASTAHGFFRDNGGAVCWDRPNDGSGCQELVSNLNAATGLVVTPATNNVADLIGVRTVTLMSTYKDHLKQNKDWSVSFDILPRNQF